MKVTLKQLWDYFKLIFCNRGRLWEHFGVTLGLMLACEGHFGVLLGPFGVTLGPLWGHLGYMVVTLLHFGIIMR